MKGDYWNNDYQPETWEELKQAGDYWRSKGDYVKADQFYKAAIEKKGGPLSETL